MIFTGQLPRVTCSKRHRAKGQTLFSVPPRPHSPRSGILAGLAQQWLWPLHCCRPASYAARVRLCRLRKEQKMRTFIAAFSIAALLLSADCPTIAQPASSPKAGPDSAAREGRRAALQKKAAACRKDGAEKGLREQDLRDYVYVCVQEARLACLKQAIEQKICGRDRVSFIDKCLTGE